MDKLYITLATSLVSVLAFIAYRHSRAFRPIYNVLLILTFSINFLLGSYNLGAGVMGSAMRTELVASKKIKVEEQPAVLSMMEHVEEANGLPMTQINWSVLAVVLYLIILRALPQILNLPEEATDK